MYKSLKVFFLFSKCPALLLSGVFLSFLAVAAPAYAAEPRVRILASTYPLYLFTRTLAQSRPDVQVDLLIPAQTGCPHDYALTPRDMQKLVKAHVLVLNGLGMEDFMKTLLQAPGRKGLTIIDSSPGIVPIAQREEGQHGHAHKDQASDNDHGHSAHHHHDGVNPHAFSSPRQAAVMVNNIARGLAKADPQGAQEYMAAGSAYAARLNGLGDQLAAVGAGAANKNVLLLHDGMAYLVRDAGLHLVGVIQESDDVQPSAARLLELTREIRKNNVAAIVGEPQYADKPVLALAAETGVPALRLDPVASGPVDAPLDHYEKIMTANCRNLEKYFGK